jgi:biopolymer transport protein ExbB/TolQ
MTDPKTSSRPNMPVSVVQPVIIGLAAFILLFTMIDNGSFGNDLVRRYLAGHPVSKVTTALFLIGLVSLCQIACDVLRQKRLLASITLAGSDLQVDSAVNPAPAVNAVAPTTEQLLGQLDRYASRTKSTWLWRRLFTALEFIRRNDSADGMDDELKYASELDHEEKHERYSFARIMIWAIPMLGFLGTVLGISEALGGINIGEDNNFQVMMAGLRGSLYIAFDTTAIALTFAIVLMFVQFAVDRAESSLLNRVELRARDELSRHWDITNQSRDTYVQAVESIGASVLESSENLVQRQVKLWRASIEAAESAWVDSVRAARHSVQESLQLAIDESTRSLGESLQHTIEKSDEAVARRWEQWQVALSENARLLVDQQQTMMEQSVMISQVMERLGDLAKTRSDLREFLADHPTGSEFADAAQSLSTAIRLLEFRFKEIADEGSRPDVTESAGDRKRTAA